MSSWNDKKEVIKKNLPEEFGDCYQHQESLKLMLRIAEDLVQLGKARNVSSLPDFVKENWTPQLNVDELHLQISHYNGVR